MKVYVLAKNESSVVAVILLFIILRGTFVEIFKLNCELFPLTVDLREFIIISSDLMDWVN
jgi:hypothetical protein